MEQAAHTATQTVKNTFASDDPCANNARNIGTAIGLGVGVLVATQVNSDLGKVATVAASGWIGNLIGADMDRKRCELHKIAQAHALTMEFQPVDVGAQSGKTEAFSMSLHDSQGEQAQFERNSDRLTPRAKDYFRLIAEQYAQQATPPANASAEDKKAWQTRMAQRKLLLIGHTDDTGSSATNAALSEKRARAVADWLAKNGVPLQQMYFQGAGEGYPLVSNATEEGRMKNRRVEFIEVYGDEALAYFLDNRRANYALYRPTDTTAAISKPAAAPQRAASATPQARKGEASASRAREAAAGPVPTQEQQAALPPAPTSAAQAAKTAPVRSAAGHVLDFGGEPLQTGTRTVALGVAAAPQKGFGLISTAHAAGNDVFIARCDLDRPRTIGAVKSLDSGKTYRTHEHLKGLYGSSWAQMLNGHLVVLHKVAVLRDGSAPNSPEVKLYANYKSSQSKTAKPVWVGNPQVNVYQGGNGLLYRMFLNSDAGVQCMDVLFPQDVDAQAKDGQLIYGPANNLYAADFKPARQP